MPTIYIITEYIDKFKVLLRGQLISLLIAGTGVFATFLSTEKPKSANFPTLMSFCNYVMLSTYLLRIYWFKVRDEHQSLSLESSHHSLTSNSTSSQSTTVQLESASESELESKTKFNRWWYLLGAVLDMEANFFVTIAYNYTSITSIMLFDCFTIPSAMILSWFFLSYRYSWRHMLGAIICIIGLSCIIITDALSLSSDSSPNALLGDIFCIVGSLLYASSNVLQESIVKNHLRYEYLGNLGFYGIFIASVQFMIVDYDKVRSTHFNMEIIAYIMGFTLCMFFMYTNTSMFLTESDATLFNLSLLTSDCYAVIFSYFLYGHLVYWTYFLAFGIVIVGLYIYYREIPPEKLHSKIQNSSDFKNDSSTKDSYVLVSNPISKLDPTSETDDHEFMNNRMI